MAEVYRREDAPGEGEKGTAGPFVAATGRNEGGAWVLRPHCYPDLARFPEAGCLRRGVAALI
jgi:hypothetical protein